MNAEIIQDDAGAMLRNARQIALLLQPFIQLTRAFLQLQLQPNLQPPFKKR